MKEHSAAQRMEREKDLPQRSQSSAASLTSIADISPSSSQFFEVIIPFFYSHKKYLHIGLLINDEILCDKNLFDTKLERFLYILYYLNFRYSISAK